MAKVVHTIKKNDYLYEHYRDDRGKVASKYLGRADAFGAGSDLQGEPRQIVAQPTGQLDVAQVNWNTSVQEGQVVWMSPQEYIERVNIFNRMSDSEVLRREVKATNRGSRGILYYPPLSEDSYQSLIKAMRDGNAMDIPNLEYNSEGYLTSQEGFHRSLVARDLGIKEIPIQVIGAMPETFKKADVRRNANVIEQKEAINQLKGKYLSKLSESIGIRESIVTKDEPELYHVSFKSNVKKIQKEGIAAKKSSTYITPMGGEVKDPDKIYAFSNFDDAVRWASKMEFDFKEPTVIIPFKGNKEEWERDTHFQSAGAKGQWLKKAGTISPENIIGTIPLTQEMRRTIVQTGGTNKELTRKQGVIEKES